MRADMAKVLVERPRPGSREGSRPDKGYRQRVRMQLADGGGPAREGIGVPYRRDPRPFNENLAPLRRFLRSQVGRPWGKVLAEIRERIDVGNVVQKHVLTHLYDTVITQVEIIDGVPCCAEPGRWWHGKPLSDLASRRAELYVCPKTGLLRAVRPKRKPTHAAPQPPAFVRVSKTLQCRFIVGRWELVTVAPLPPVHLPIPPHVRDVVLGKSLASLSRPEARKTYGAEVYAVGRRVLSRREQKQLPIPIEFVR